MRAPAVLACAAALAVLATAARPAAAQLAPSPAEVASYAGLHAAAQRGDVAAIERIAAASPNTALDARDGHGRTPLHVAAFARQRDAARALIRAGADSGALDDDRYDAVTRRTHRRCGGQGAWQVKLAASLTSPLPL